MATNTEQFFQSSLLAEQMESIWTGAVVANNPQYLTESEKAQARENIGAVAFGSLLKILGNVADYDTLSKIKNPKVGDAYSVGAEPPYNLWIYDGLRGQWKDYGAIRATAVSSTYIENYTISPTAWKTDDSPFVDYPYKASVPFEGATNNDYPHVDFDPVSAARGNLCPVCFAHDGVIDIFAKTNPYPVVTVYTATIIVNGGNGKGGTNANASLTSQSIATDKLMDGAVTAAKLADGAIPIVYTFDLDSALWSGDDDVFNIGVFMDSLTPNSKVDIQLNAATIKQLIDDGIYALYTENNGSNLFVYAIGGKPSRDIRVQFTVEEVRR